MDSFPLEIVPAQAFNQGGLAFGNDRGEVDHAACDLVVPAGTRVLAVSDGVVWYGPSKFFDSKPGPGGGSVVTTYEMAVIHGSNIARYGEIGPTLPSGVRPGASVKAGQHIASVGHQNGSTMLHFELYADVNRKDPLTQKGNATYLHVGHLGKRRFNRRSDLLDPTMNLLILSWSKRFSWSL